MSLQDLRRQYMLGGLQESDCPADPIDLFRTWFSEAVRHNEIDWFEPNAMTLATASPDGDVTARIVLLKHFDEHGFVFFTNYDSTKGKQLSANPRAALLFYWPHLERQVRIEGCVELVSREMSERYFHSRPRGSQLGASVSPQSRPLSRRDELESAVAEMALSLGDASVPLPDFWGGYCLQPQRVEFWQGRENRLHDRICYEAGEAGWTITRLAP